MNKNNIFFLFVLVFIFSACSSIKNPARIKSYVQITTSAGSFVIGLYEGTPSHKYNFINNVNDKKYDSCLVYSIIPNGIFRLGLPQNKAEDKLMNDNFSESRMIPELNDKLINKTGAVGMLRLPDEMNKDVISDNMLFYVVDGIPMDDKTLNTLEMSRNAPLIAGYINTYLDTQENSSYRDSLNFYKSNRMNDQWNRLYADLTKIVIPIIKADGKELFSIGDYQREIYKSIGGAPLYDSQYTVFGEIVYGKEILRKLSETKTNIRNQPKENIYILSAQILSKKEFKNLK